MGWVGGEWHLSGRRELSTERFAALEEHISLVRDLSRQRPVEQLVAATRRWQHTLTEVSDFGEGPVVDPSALRDLGLDLVAIVRAADLGGLGYDQSERTPKDTVAAAELAAYREHVRSSRSYLTCRGLAERAERGDLVVEVRDGVVRLGGYSGSPVELPTGLLGYVIGLCWFGMKAVRAEFDAAAREIELAVSSLDKSSRAPVLAALTIGDDGDVTHIQVSGLPLVEIQAIRRFLEMSPDRSDPAEMVSASQELASISPAGQLMIGDTEVTPMLIDGRSREGLDAIPEATFEVDLGLMGSSALDFWASVQHSIADREFHQDRFSGAVQEVEILGSVMDVSCEGAVDMTELRPGGLVSVGVSPGELITSLAEQAGLPRDTIVLSEPVAAPDDETIEVVVPIRGISVNVPVTVGPATFLPASAGRQKLEPLNLETEEGGALAAAYRDADCYAMASMQGDWLQKAEALGLQRLTAALSWIAVRGRYGLARLPDGSAVPFSRQEALRPPKLGDVILVAGSSSRRMWLRRSSGPDQPVLRDVSQGCATVRPELPSELPNSLRLGLVAFAQASLESEVERQLQGLWSAIEFYVSGISPPPAFKPEELAALEELAPESLSNEQRERFRSAVRGLNGSPLVDRLKAALRSDGVRLSEGDEQLLFVTLRRARNDVVHGREMKKIPSRAAINGGFGLVARMLVHRIASLDRS